MKNTMKVRIISGAIGVALIVLALIFLHTIFFNILISIFSVIACFEIFSANKALANKPIMFLNFAVSAILPFMNYFSLNAIIVLLVSYFIIFMAFVVLNHNFKNFNKTITVSAEALLYGFCFYSIVALRDMYILADGRGFVKADGIYFLLLAMAVSWGADTGAYFTGIYFGKRKLAPHVSEGKTVEGFLGGICSSVILVLLVSVFYKMFTPYEISSINYFWVIFIGIFGCIVGVIGDLFASCIKRSNELKDFGEIMPGHGGIMDRFDSISLVAPFLLTVLCFVQILQRF